MVSTASRNHTSQWRIIGKLLLLLLSANYSTIHILITIRKGIMSAQDNNTFACGDFIAFYTIPHNIYLKELIWVGNLNLSNRKQHAYINGYASNI